MSEAAKHSGEHHAHKGEHLDTAAESRKNIERIHEKAETSQETSQAEVHHLKHKAETHAVSGKEFTVGEKESTGHGSHTYSDQKAIKTDAYRKTLKTVRSQLSKPEKTFSKIVHQKTIDNISEVSAKTVARPSGILGGGICALAGSAFLLYMTKHYGFEYNYFIFLLLFVGGFFVGMFGELVVRSVFRKS